LGTIFRTAVSRAEMRHGIGRVARTAEQSVTWRA
jgi:hypothetical protein